MKLPQRPKLRRMGRRTENNRNKNLKQYERSCRTDLNMVRTTALFLSDSRHLNSQKLLFRVSLEKMETPEEYKISRLFGRLYDTI